MECRNCGKKRLKNLQAIRGHLRFCPDRYSEGATDARTGASASRGLSSAARQLFVPYTAIPLLEGPGIAHLEETALAIGIPSRAARVAANYVGFNGNLDDAMSMWNLLQECIEIGPGAMRQLLRSWCGARGIPLEEWQMDEMAVRE